MTHRARSRKFGPDFTSLREVTAGELRFRLMERSEVALVDVRQEGAFAVAHPLFAASMPHDRIDQDVWDRIPRRSACIVLYDEGGDLAHSAATKLAKLGYTRLSLLRGGLAAWRDAGGELFGGLDASAAAFAELVDARRQTPWIEALELHAMLRRREDVAVLDARTVAEFEKLSIPTAQSVPAGELVLRVRDIASDPRTLVVVHCAGCSQSIIGAQSLIDAAIPNRVVALRHGTIGWTLAGLPVVHGRTAALSAVRPSRAREAAAAARRVADLAGVRRIDRATLARWAMDPRRTLYRFDVRTPEEYACGHLPGFRSAPGGQLIQEIEVFAPVRGARIVLADEDGARSSIAASWLAQMGFEVAVLELSGYPHREEA